MLKLKIVLNGINCIIQGYHHMINNAVQHKNMQIDYYKAIFVF